MQVPKLPYDPIQQAALPGVQNNYQASPDQYGAGIGRAVEQTGDDLYRIGVKAKDEADHVAVNDKLNEFDTRNNKRLAEAGQKRGQQAFDLPATVNEGIDKDQSDLSGELTNEAQKKLFSEQVAGRRVASNRFVDGHVAGQASAYRDEVYDAGKSTTTNTVGINFADEGVVNAAINAQVNRTERYANDTGKSPEWRAQEHLGIVSGAHATVISQFLSNEDTAGAQAHFDRYQSEIDTKSQEAIKRSLGGAIDLKKSQSAVDALLAKPGEFQGGIGLQSGLDQIRDQYKDEPRAREMAEQRWTTSYRQRENSYKDENNAIFSRLLSTVADPQNPQGLDAANPLDQSALMSRDPELFVKIQNFNAMKMRREEPKTNPMVMLALQRMAVLDPVEFSRPETMYNNINNLSPADFKGMVEMQRETLQNGNRGAQAQGIITRDAVVDNLYRQVFQKEKKDWTETDRTTADQFTTILDNAVRAQQTATGKAMIPSEVKDLGERLLVQRTVAAPPGGVGNVVNIMGLGLPGYLLGIGKPGTKEVPAFSAPGADRTAFAIAQVPESYRKAADAKIRAKGGTPSNDQILNAYNADVLKQPNAQ